MPNEALQRVGGQVPGPSLIWMLSGTVLLAWGLWTTLTGFLALYNPDNMLSLSLRFLPTGLPLVCLGSGLLGLGLVKRKSSVASPALPLPPEYRERLLPLLTEKDTTVGDLVRKSGLSESQVVLTLDTLEKQGEIQEELNTDTGQYFYQPTEPSDRPLSLQERMERQDKP